MVRRRGRLIGLAVAAALAAPAAAQADTTGLVAAYGFEETGPTAVDSSPIGTNPGMLAGATRSAAGRFGGALSFDGVDDRVNVADSNSLDLSAAMTLEAWVNPTQANASWRTVLLKEQPAALAYALYSDEGSARPSVHVFTSRELDTRGTAAAPLNAWTHIAATYDGATLRLYVNGTQTSSKAVSGAIKTSTGALRIGGNAIWGEYFKGTIDEVRVYNRALTAAEIGADMAAPIVPADPPPSAPGTLTASRSGDDVSLSWGAATDNAGVTGYRVHRGTSAGFAPSAANLLGTVSGTSYLDLDRPAGTYYYKVVAVDTASQTGPSSNELSVSVPPDTMPPTAPGTLTASVNEDDIVVQWTAASDDVSVANYRVYRSTTPGFTPAAANLLVTTGGSETSSTRFNEPAGTYYYRVIAVDSTGNAGPASNEASATVAPDTTPPTLTLDGPCPRSEDRSAAFTGLATDERGNESVYIFPRIDGATMPAHMWERHTGSGGDYSVGWDTYYVADGTYSITIVARDAAGNETVSAPCEVTVDNIPLSIDFGSLTDGATVSGTIALTATSHYGDVVTGAFTRIKIDGQQVAQTASGVATYNWNTSGYANGSTHTLTAEMLTNYPASPPYKTTTIQVTVDNADHTPPTVAIDGTCPRTLSETTVIYGTGADNSGRTPSTELRLDGTRLATGYFVGGIGPWSAEWDTRYTPNGTYTLTAVARDAAGNETTSAPCEVTIDNTELTAAFVTPADGATVSGTPILRVQAYEDGQPVTWGDVVYKVDGVQLPGPPLATQPWNTTGLPNGSVHTLTAELTSGYPNDPPYATTTIHVTVDNSPESVPPTAPGNLAAAVDDDDVQLTWDASTDNVGVNEYRLYRSGTAGFTPSEATRIRTTSVTSVSLRQTTGTQYYKVVAADGAGNVSAPSNERTVVVAPDTTPPTVEITTDCTTVSGTVTIWAHADDNRLVKAREIRVDGVLLPGSIPVDWDTNLTTNGPHTITAVARDEDGNEGTSAPCVMTVANPVVSPAGLVAAYGFEETSGTAVADSSGTGNVGTVSGATRSATGKFGRALSFDGVNDFVSVPDASALDLTSALTLEAWVKPTTVSGSTWRTVLMKERPGGLAYALYAAAGINRPSANLWAGGSETEARGSTISNNVWTHLAVTYNSVAVRLYMNGVESGTAPLISPVTVSTGALKIGGNAVWPEWFSGTIDEVRVYNRSLSAAEIQADRDRPAGG